VGGRTYGRMEKQVGRRYNSSPPRLKPSDISSPIQRKTGVKLPTEAHFVTTVRVVVSQFFGLTIVLLRIHSVCTV
jgi:hypothetical protein